MKKLLSAAMALALAFSLAACGGTADTGAADTVGDTADTEAAADTTADTDEAADAGETGDADAAAESDLAAIQDAGKMVIGYTVYEPMNYTDENGVFTGFDTELATMVCDILGVEPEFVEINWDTKFIDLEAGNIDAVWNGMTLSDEIEQNQACSKPYAMNAQVIVMKADNDYADTSSLVGKAIAVEQGSAGADAVAADENLSQADVVGKAVQTECLMEVAAGTADAAVLDLTLARAMTGEGTDYADLVIVDSLNEEEYGVAFRKGSDVAEAVNAAFDQLVSENKMYELSQKYDIALADGMLPAAQ